MVRKVGEAIGNETLEYGCDVVLIYERTKEELRAGLNVKEAMKKGYSNAFSASFDITIYLSIQIQPSSNEEGAPIGITILLETFTVPAFIESSKATAFQLVQLVLLIFCLKYILLFVP